MYTLKLLAPLIATSCVEGITKEQGDFCVRSEPAPIVRYYEPGKSCYDNGVFYSDCANRP